MCFMNYVFKSQVISGRSEVFLVNVHFTYFVVVCWHLFVHDSYIKKKSRDFVYKKYVFWLQEWQNMKTELFVCSEENTPNVSIEYSK
jgi:hypothetical protein